MQHPLSLRFLSPFSSELSEPEDVCQDDYDSCDTNNQENLVDSNDCHFVRSAHCHSNAFEINTVGYVQT